MASYNSRYFVAYRGQTRDSGTGGLRMLAKCFTILVNLFNNWYKRLGMLDNAIVNLTNVLRVKREHGAYVTNLHNTHCGYFSLSYSLCPMSLFSFKFVLIVHIRPEFYANLNTNASESIQTSYDRYKCLANNKNGLRMVTNMLRMVTNMLRICFLCEF